jgi:hypothetical protein
MRHIKKINEIFDEFNDSQKFNTEQYWIEVASALNGTLEQFDLEEYRRIIVIYSSIYGQIKIIHDWKLDGTSTKPRTYINGNDKFGRLAIWDDPILYAEDIVYSLNSISNDSNSTVNDIN